MSLLIHGGTVIDPANGRHGRYDIIVADGRIVEITEAADSGFAGERFDAAGCWVLPGLIDLHVHLREPGYEYKETVATGTLAAVAGGFTAVACMANTLPVNDSAAVTEYILERAAEVALARVYPIGAVSVGLKGERLAEIGEMHRAGIVAISDDGEPVADAALMRRALEYSRMFNLPVIAHEEDHSLAAGGVMNEGPTAFRLGLKGMPAAAEEVMIARDLALLDRTGGKLHVAHLSTAGAVDLVRQGKARGLAVTAEVTPHHFTLTEEAVEGYQTNAKMKPPLRTAADVSAVIDGLRDGTIDAIATDHAPHHRDAKDVEFDAAANGTIGLETALALAVRLTQDQRVSIDTVVRALSAGPASIIGVPGGHLSPGAAADITIFDPRRSWPVDSEHLHSKSHNTAFAGWQMEGRVIATWVDGRLVWRAEDNKVKRGRARETQKA